MCKVTVTILLPCRFPLTSTVLFFFFFNDPAPTEIYPLPLHDAFPISHRPGIPRVEGSAPIRGRFSRENLRGPDHPGIHGAAATLFERPPHLRPTGRRHRRDRR